MGAPLDDPRAADLLAARPDDVSALAATFRTAAGEAGMTAHGLSGARHDGHWMGRAADAFRRAIGRLPLELSRVRAGYAEVGDALARYEPDLARIQSQFVHVVDELSGAHTQLGPAQTAVQTARGSFKSTVQDKRAQRRALTAAELALAQADGALDGYRREITRLTGRAFSLLDEFSAARDACRNSIAAAQGTAPVRPHPDRGTTVIDTVGRVAAPGGAFLAGAPGPGSTATDPPAEARRRIEAMIKRADALLGTPYAYGGGHGAWGAGGGLDCSGFVSAILRSGGYLSSPQTTEGFAAQPDLSSGQGRFVTIYDRTGCGANEHVIIDLNGHFYESGGGSASGGAPFVHRFSPSSAYLQSFNTILHPAGL